MVWSMGTQSLVEACGQLSSRGRGVECPSSVLQERSELSVRAKRVLIFS